MAIHRDLETTRHACKQKRLGAELDSSLGSFTELILKEEKELVSGLLGDYILNDSGLLHACESLVETLKRKG